MWLTLRPPTPADGLLRLRQVVERVRRAVGPNYIGASFRRTFSRRILADDRMTLTDAQALMRHRNLDTLNAYAAARLDELVAALHRHLATPAPCPPSSSIRYDAGDLAVLFPGMSS